MCIGPFVGNLPHTPAGSLRAFLDDSEDGAAAGCLVGVVAGVSIPFIGIHNYQVNPPAERLLGKLSESVEFYTDAYRSKTRSLRGGWAAGGFGAAVGVPLLSWLLFYPQ